MAKRSRNSTSTQSEKLYTFTVSVSFDMQFTFRQNEVQPAEEGGEDDVDPADEALAELENELKEYLGQSYPIGNIEAFADFESLLGAVESPTGDKPANNTVREPVFKSPVRRLRSKPRA